MVSDDVSGQLKRSERYMKKLMLSILAIILIIEEWLWDGLTSLGHLLIRRLRLESVERWLGQISPNAALVAVLIPLMIVTPINLFAFAMLARGLILQGILLEILAKLLGTLLVARVFALTKPQLMTFSVIAVLYSTITGWLQWAHQKITDTLAYKIMMSVKTAAKARFRGWFS
jgi:hypothetical protein